jgi:hypothetical protein
MRDRISDQRQRFLTGFGIIPSNFRLGTFSRWEPDWEPDWLKLDARPFTIAQLLDTQIPSNDALRRAVETS